nr:MAG TPA: structural protein [Caudoviricetes sp.]
MKAYPYDPRGTKAENHFLEERIIGSENNNDRVVILDHRPFFEDLVVRQPGSTTPLSRGVDYELQYQLTELDDSVAANVYCGVHLINPSIKGIVTFEGQMLGGTFYDPFVDILDELVKYLNNPVSADWLLLDGRPSLYPATPAATSWADLLNKKYLASAVHDIELKTDDANQLIKDKLAEVKALVTALGKEIEAFNYPAHIAAKNPHETTSAQINAHPVNLKTPDTFMAYGLKLKALTDELKAFRLPQSVIDTYISHWISSEVRGVFNCTVSGNRAQFRSKNGESEIIFANDGFTLKSNGSVVLAVGHLEGTGAGRYINWRAGKNTLRIESTGDALGMNKLTLNGNPLLTTTALMEYQQDPDAGGSGGGDPDDSKVYIEGRNGISFTGKGSRTDPIVGTIDPTKATTAEKGVVKLKTGKGTETVGVAATPASLTPYSTDLSGYVAKTTMINGKPMNDGSRTITKADLGLGQADNTADLDKPLSTELTKAVSGLADVGHHHDWSELGIYKASQSVYGIGRYATNQNGLVENRAVVPNILKELSARLSVVAAAIANAKEGTVTDFAAVKGADWRFNSQGTAISVQDLKYFYLLDGTKGDSTVTGAIDLQTTPMFNWFSPNNQLELTWATGKVSNGTGINWTGIEEPPLMGFQSVPVGKTATQMGDQSVVTVLAKTRVKAYQPKLWVYAAGGGPVTVYINGIQAATGQSPLVAVYETSSDVENYTVAVKAECSDTTKSAAVQFEVYDGDYPVYFSGPETRVELLQEFVTTHVGVRHYLYVNMLTGSLYSRAEPIQSIAVDPERGYIGYVDIVPGQSYANKTVGFETTFDFGKSAEVSEHISTRKAHGLSAVDWALTDNPRLPLLNRAIAEPRACIFRKPLATATGDVFHLVSRGLYTYAHNQNVKSSLQYVVIPEGATPYCWFTPFNPKENNAPTFEGSFAFDVDDVGGTQALAAAPDLVLCTSTQGSSVKRRYLRIDLTTKTCKLGIGSRSDSAVTDIPLVMEESGETAVAATFKDVLFNGEETNAATLDLIGWGASRDKIPANHAPRGMIRYRYNVNSRVLRLALTFSQFGTTTVKHRQLEIQFPFDLVDYFTGDGVGLSFKELSAKCRVTISHALIDPATSNVDIDKYHYLRSLFESYLDSSVGYLADTKDVDFSQSVIDPATYEVSQKYRVTESIALPTGQGSVAVSHDGQLPAQFFDRKLSRGALMAKKGELNASWNNEWSTTKAAASRYRHKLILRFAQGADKQQYRVAKVAGTVKSNWPGKVIIGDAGKDPYVSAIDSVSFALSTASDTGKAITLTPKDLRVGQDIYIVLEPPGNNPEGYELNFTCSLDVTDEKSVRQDQLNAQSFELRSGESQFLMEKRNPYHITSKAWKWILAVLKRELNGKQLGDRT